MENKIDWLTLSIKPEKTLDSVEEFHNCIKMLREVMLLDELWGKLVNKGRCRFYDTRLSYNDVNIKIPLPEKFGEQGIAVELSGNGLVFFCEYLRSYGMSLRLWCSKFRALSLSGWTTKCTRFDLAFDDKVFDGNRPTLTMRKVCDAICEDEVAYRARIITDDCSDLVTFKRRYKRGKDTNLWGTTVSIGSRDSGTYVRFYDKRVEQLQKKIALPDNLTSWVRCEFEFKEENALSMFNLFCDYDSENFGKKGCEVALNHIKFIDRFSNNVSRCPVKRWWKRFLNGCSKSFQLPKIAPQRSALAKSKRWLDAQLISTIVTYMQMLSVDGFVEYVQSMAEEIEKNGKPAIRKEIIDNYKDNKRYYEEVRGFKRWSYASDRLDEEMKKEMRWTNSEYAYQLRNVNDTPEKYGYFGAQMGFNDGM